MGLFDKFKKLVSDDNGSNNLLNIVSPLEGEIIAIEDVPDVIFAEKIVGDGIAIVPTGNKIVAPVTGEIVKIYETNHAFAIRSKEGLEVLVHFGLDTVELRGEGFTRIAEEGQNINAGETIIEFDLALLTEKAKSVITPCIVSNMDEIKSMTKLTGAVKAGETVVLEIVKD